MTSASHGQFRIPEPMRFEMQSSYTRRTRNNSVERNDVEIFVRPMRYKGCHQAQNAKVVICALFTTPNSLKLQERRKAFLLIRKVRAISQKLYSHSQPRNPAASDAPPRHTSRGFLHWRLSDDGPGASRIVPIGRHPKPFTTRDSCTANLTLSAGE